MTGLVDLHCHVLPYVDDGAARKEESMRLLEMQYEQGVRTICVTPHLRQRMFESADEDIRLQFERLKERAGALPGPVKLFLSREYYADKGLLAKLEAGEVLPLGEGRHLLVEFSRHSEEDIHRYLDAVQSAGYTPLIAHVERYPALSGRPEAVEALKMRGCRIQINAGSILGREGLKQKHWSHRLLKLHLADVVASDAHDPQDRPPELDLCCRKLTRRYGEARARQLLCADPLHILLGTEGDA